MGQGKEAEEVDPGDMPSSASLGKNPVRRNDDVKLQERHGPQLFPEPDFKYHEWDFKRGAYREDWCHLYEVPVVPGDPNYVNQVKHKYRAYIWQIRRQLEMIKGEDKIAVAPGRRRGNGYRCHDRVASSITRTAENPPIACSAAACAMSVRWR